MATSAKKTSYIDIYQHKAGWDIEINFKTKKISEYHWNLATSPKTTIVELEKNIKKSGKYCLHKFVELWIILKNINSLTILAKTKLNQLLQILLLLKVFCFLSLKNKIWQHLPRQNKINFYSVYFFSVFKKFLLL